jgi:hypothetical protein
VIATLLGLAVALQVWRDRLWQPYEPATAVLWLQNAEGVRKAAMGFDALLADLYWMRAVVYFGRQRLSEDPDKNYDLLYPLLDFVTTLDYRFKTAYRFGAVFLSEPYPDGPDRPDLAIGLLKRGMQRTPERWEYPHDIGFVYFWAQRDYAQAAEWFERASHIPGAPNWLKSTAAAMLAREGDRESARRLWQQMKESADSEWIHRSADLHLAQYDAMDAIDALNQVLWTFKLRHGYLPRTWHEVMAAGMLRAIPRDPTGAPYAIDSANEVVDVSQDSALWPIPREFPFPGQ